MKRLWGIKQLLIVFLLLFTLFGAAQRVFAATYVPYDGNLSTTFNTYAIGVLNSPECFNKDYIYFRSGDYKYTLLVFDSTPTVEATRVAGSGHVYTWTTGSYNDGYTFNVSSDPAIQYRLTDRLYYSNLDIPVPVELTERGFIIYVQAAVFGLAILFMFRAALHLFKYIRTFTSVR